jgi:hypothetical protein
MNQSLARHRDDVLAHAVIVKNLPPGNRARRALLAVGGGSGARGGVGRASWAIRAAAHARHVGVRTRTAS